MPLWKFSLHRLRCSLDIGFFSDSTNLEPIRPVQQVNGTVVTEINQPCLVEDFRCSGAAFKKLGMKLQ